jgi:MFS family permease
VRIPTPNRTTGLGSIFLVLFVDLVSFGIVFPLYAKMLEWYAGHGILAWLMHGASALVPAAEPWQQAALFGGILGAIYSGLQFIAAPLWGRMSDRYGRRPILLVSLIGSFLANLLWVFSADFGLLLLSRILAGMMTGNVAVANAAVADITTEQNRSRGMAAVGMAFGLGFILGPAIGGFLAELRPDLWWPASTAYGINPFSAPAAVAATLAGINLMWAYTAFNETLPPERRSAHPTSTRTMNPLAIFRGDLPPRLHAINVAFCLHTLLFSGMEATLVFLGAQRLGLDAFAFGMIFAWMGVCSVAVQAGLFRPHSARIGVQRLAAVGFALTGVGFTLTALVDHTPSLTLLICGVSFQAFGTGLVFPGLATMASLAAPADRQGYAMGTFRSASALGRAIGPLVAAIAYFLISPAAPYWLGAVGMLIPIWLIRRLGPSVPPAV